MTKFTKAVVHHAEDMFAWRVPNENNQMHWVADLSIKELTISMADGLTTRELFAIENH